MDVDIEAPQARPEATAPGGGDDAGDDGDVVELPRLLPTKPPHFEPDDAKKRGVDPLPRRPNHGKKSRVQ